MKDDEDDDSRRGGGNQSEEEEDGNENDSRRRGKKDHMVSAGIKVGERVKSGAKSYVKGSSNNVQKKAKA